MSFCKASSLNRCLTLTIQCGIFKRQYAKAASSVSMLGMKKGKKVVGKVGVAMEKKILPVETDPVKLVNYCCGSNFYKTGEDIKLGADSEYPEWLWSVNTGPDPTLDELDPNTKEYWLEVRRQAIRRNYRLKKLEKF